MPIRFSDKQVAKLHSRLEAQQRSDPHARVNAEQILELLSLVGDGAGMSSRQVAQKLRQPGLTREQQIGLVKKGLSKSELNDLSAFLQSSTVSLAPDARAFLEAVVHAPPQTPGTPPAPPQQPPAQPPTQPTALQVTGSSPDGLAGFAKSGAAIEAINLSRAPTGRLTLNDTSFVAKAGDDGRFSMAQLTGEQAMREGDLIRLRARYSDGSTSDWVTVKASGLEATDRSNAAVALFRIGLIDNGNGQVAVTNINASRQISEPGAVLEFTNKRTSEKARVTLTENGSFPAGFTLKGQPGDSFSVAASDGVNNLNFAETVGNVTVPGGTAATHDLLPDPALHQGELDAAGKPRFSKVNFTGPLFVGPVSPNDVQQGQIGNCYFPAAIAAIAHQNPEAIQNMIRDNGDGTYTVTFKQMDYISNKYRDVAIKVDGDLWARSYGGPLYGRSSNSADPKQMELWFPLLEKAYAYWKGSYDTIGNGGNADAIFECVLGRSRESLYVTEGSLNFVFEKIKESIDRKLPVAAATYSDSSRYPNTGVYGDHAYSVLGYEEKDGQRFVTLRNPWGESEPANNGANDGVFTLKLEEFLKLYESIMYTS